MEDLGAITDTAGVELTTGDQLPVPVALRSWHKTTVWTEARTERMKVLLGEGLSCSMIAADLGGGLTRNAVIGKISRMGLRTADKRVPKVCKPARTSAGRTRKSRTTEAGKRAGAAPDAEWVPSWRFPERPVNHGHPHPKPTEATGIVVDFVPPNPVRIWGLEEQHCRFILGEPSEMLFCGEPKRDQFGCPYCAFHMRITHQMSAPRKPWVPGRVEG